MFPRVKAKMGDFDSGDHLLNDIDTDQRLSNHPLPPATKRKREIGVNDYGDKPKRQQNHGEDTLAFDDDEGNIMTDVDAPPDDVSDELDSANISAGMHLAQKLLTETFGYEAFRHEQEGAIRRILAGKNALTIFPTGAGKSLCYQIPAIAFEQLDLKSGSRAAGEHGLSIVVSPLVALMKDQVDALKRRRLPADCIYWTKTGEQEQHIYAAVREGKIRLLYCSPERLDKEGFVATMQHVRGGVRLLAVDEAHCISEWGHSFRPQYLKVARFAEEIKAERVVCLTATATQEVANGICNAFSIQPEGVFRTSTYRSNLNLYAQAASTKQEKYPLVIQFLKDNPGPTLVYVTLQQQAVQLAADLQNQGFDAEAYHAGLHDTKPEIQDKFLANEVCIVVATIAFGMGIDKPDIRNIVHFDLSSTIEEYCQKIGRAGRDGKPSNCMFYLCPDDWYIRENFARGDLPSYNSLKKLMINIFGHGNAFKPVGETFKTDHHAQSSDFDIRPNPLAIIYAELELKFGLIRALTPEYSEYKFKPTRRFLELRKMEKSPEGKAIYASASDKKGKFRYVEGKFHHVDVNDIVLRTGIHRVDIVRKLNEWKDAGLIKLEAKGVKHKYRILQPLPQSSEEIETLTDTLHAILSQREEDALCRTKKVEDFITGDKCLALALEQHFGMDLPDGRLKCGHCTHCLTGRRTVMPPRRPREVDMVGIKRILDVCKVRDDPRFLARIAFGIKSPRMEESGLDKRDVFGSLADHDFESLLRVLTRACNTAATE